MQAPAAAMQLERDQTASFRSDQKVMLHGPKETRKGTDGGKQQLLRQTVGQYADLAQQERQVLRRQLG